jgi:DNA-binding GntR family transcriptional regulator
MPSKDYLRDQIPQQIAGEIILGRIFPGEKLTEISLCEGSKVSRTPVREALMLIEKQGFVENSKNAIATVGKGTQEKFLEYGGHLRRAGRSRAGIDRARREDSGA